MCDVCDVFRIQSFIFDLWPNMYILCPLGSTSAVTVVMTGTTAAVWALPSLRPIVWTRISVQYVNRSSPLSLGRMSMHPQCHCKNDIGLNFDELSPVFRLTATVLSKPLCRFCYPRPYSFSRKVNMSNFQPINSYNVPAIKRGYTENL